MFRISTGLQVILNTAWIFPVTPGLCRYTD